MRYQVVLPDDLAGWVTDTARQDGRSVSAWLRRIIERERAKSPPSPRPADDGFPFKQARPIVGPSVHSTQPEPPSLATLRAQTQAVAQRPKRTALVASSDGRGGA